MRNATRLFLWVLPVALLATGCVKKSLYQKAMADLDAANKQGTMLTRQLEECKAGADALGRQQKECEAKLAAAGGDVSRLKDLTASLSTDLGESRRAVEEMKARNAQQEARLQTYRNLLERFQSLISSGQLDVQIVRGRMVVKLAEGILFDSAKADIKSGGKTVLSEVTRVLASIPNRNFQIEGHTDNVPLKGSGKFPSNWELSAARAAEVVKYMISQGMAPERLSAAGFAEFTPVAPNDTPEHRALNRRIEIVLMPNLDELPSFDELKKAQ